MALLPHGAGNTLRLVVREARTVGSVCAVYICKNLIKKSNVITKEAHNNTIRAFLRHFKVTIFRSTHISAL